MLAYNSKSNNLTESQGKILTPLGRFLTQVNIEKDSASQQRSVSTKKSVQWSSDIMRLNTMDQTDLVSNRLSESRDQIKSIMKVRTSANVLTTQSSTSRSTSITRQLSMKSAAQRRGG